jgi:hypothetical protein
MSVVLLCARRQSSDDLQEVSSWLIMITLATIVGDKHVRQIMFVVSRCARGESSEDLHKV